MGCGRTRAKEGGVTYDEDLHRKVCCPEVEVSHSGRSKTVLQDAVREESGEEMIHPKKRKGSKGGCGK
jgi:hypothetical protein